MENDKLTESIKLLLFIFLIIGALYFAREFLIPITISGLFAILVLPVCEKLEEWGVPKGLASLAGLLTIAIILSSITYAMTSQLANFVNDLPALERQLADKVVQVKEIIEDFTGIPREEQRYYINRGFSNLLDSLGVFAQRLLTFTAEAAIFLLLLSFYTFFFIHYRKKFHKFFLQVVSRAKHVRAEVVLDQTTKTVNRYLLGVLGVVSILTVINTVGLLIIGIRHAFFLGFLAGLLNIIPFIGSFTGSIIPIIIALLTKDSLLPAIAVAALFTFNQTFESYVLTPNITGSQVRMNPLATLMALIVGGLLWGIAGMVLFIPIMGIVKVILDHIPHLKPYAYLISDEE